MSWRDSSNSSFFFCSSSSSNIFSKMWLTSLDTVLRSRIRCGVKLAAFFAPIAIMPNRWLLPSKGTTAKDWMPPSTHARTALGLGA